jgi:hypothetical protein
VRKFDSNGKLTGWSLCSIRQSRDPTFDQPVTQAQVPLRAGDRGRRA